MPEKMKNADQLILVPIDPSNVERHRSKGRKIVYRQKTTKNGSVSMFTPFIWAASIITEEWTEPYTRNVVHYRLPEGVTANDILNDAKSNSRFGHWEEVEFYYIHGRKK